MAETGKLPSVGAADLGLCPQASASEPGRKTSLCSPPQHLPLTSVKGCIAEGKIFEGLRSIFTESSKKGDFGAERLSLDKQVNCCQEISIDSRMDT